MKKRNKRNSVSHISAASLCSSCGACVVVCPKEAITIEETKLGRKYASISNECIECGLCKKSCPSIHNESQLRYTDRFIGEIGSVFVGRASNEQYFRNSQSGGGVTALLLSMFDAGLIDGALVCQSVPGENPYGKPVIIRSALDLLKTQKSYYCQVAMLTGLKDTEMYSALAVVGLPCQITALENMMGMKKVLNVKYKIGLICDRSLCGGIQSALKRWVGMTGSFSITWREKCLDGKTIDYANAPVVLRASNGGTEILSSSKRMALKNMFTPPRCWVCPDKLNPLADIVFGDPWGIHAGDFSEGESLVVVRTDVGRSLLDSAIGNGYFCNMRPVEVAEVANGQHIDARRHQVSNYVAAMKLTPFFRQEESYLTNQKYTKISPKEVVLSLHRLLQFRKLESGTRGQYMNKAQEILDKND